MRHSTAVRILADQFGRGSLRRRYRIATEASARMARLVRPASRPFLRVAAQDAVRFALRSVQPIDGECQPRMKAAVGWLLRAQESTPDDGVAIGYFPCDSGSPWRGSYPETTGYIITSLLDYADRTGDDEVRRRALGMATWEVRIQMPSGAVQGGVVCAPELQTPCAFNTGMVLDGLRTAFTATRDPEYLRAGVRAAEFLLSDLTPEHYFRTNGEFVTRATIKTYNCLCAWALYRTGVLATRPEFCEAAVRVVEAALRQQNAVGWFAHNCLSRPDAPLTHTIGYTIQGILEVGLIAGRPDFIEAARRGLDPLLERVSRRGFLPGRFYSDWEPAVFSSCLTGSAQIAVVCYRLHQSSGDTRYRVAGDRLLNFLKPLQLLDTEYDGVRGALPGSFPLFGDYMTARYPNWATKYLLDALMLQDSAGG